MKRLSMTARKSRRPRKLSVLRLAPRKRPRRPPPDPAADVLLVQHTINEALGALDEAIMIIRRHARTGLEVHLLQDAQAIRNGRGGRLSKIDGVRTGCSDTTERLR